MCISHGRQHRDAYAFHFRVTLLTQQIVNHVIRLDHGRINHAAQQSVMTAQSQYRLLVDAHPLGALGRTHSRLVCLRVVKNEEIRSLLFTVRRLNGHPSDPTRDTEAPESRTRVDHELISRILDPCEA